MKFNFKFSTLLVLLFTLSLVACKDDEPTLEGTWKVDLISFDCINPLENRDIVFEEEGHCQTQPDFTVTCWTQNITFTSSEVTLVVITNSDGITIDTWTEIGTYIIDEDNITMTLDDGSVSAGTYTVTNNQYKINYTTNLSGCIQSLQATRQ